MATYYVSLTGDNGDPGTMLEPWATIAYAITQVVPEDTIYVRGGTYDEALAFTVSGSIGAPITLQPYEEEPVTIDGGANPAIKVAWGTPKKNYWTIDGFTLDSDATNTILFDAWQQGTDYWIIRNNLIIGMVNIHGSYNLFENNEVDGSQHKGNEDGVWERGTSSAYDITHHNTFRNNHIHHFNSRGLWSMQRTHDSIFEDNHVHDIGGGGVQYPQGIDLDGYGNVVWSHIARRNHVHDVTYCGVQLENAFDTIAENNIVHDCGDLGIYIINYELCEPSNGYGGENCLGLLNEDTIRQNLVYRCGVSYQAGIMAYYAGGLDIWGNTVYGGDGYSIKLWGTAPGCKIQSNIGYGSTAGGIQGVGDTVIDHNLTTDPLFLDAANDNYRLREGSAAINAGIDIGLTTDLDGKPRPQGAGYDIGAYEFHAWTGRGGMQGWAWRG